MSQEIRNMEEEVRQLQKRIERAKEEELELNDPAKTLADLIHKITCRGNHVDYCGWEYEKASDYKRAGSTRNRYYTRAVSFLAGENPKEIIRLFNKFLTIK